MMKIFKVTIISGWIVLWAVFHFMSSAEDLAVYKEVKGLSLDEKHAYLIGKELHDFLLFCRTKLPPRQMVSSAGNFKGYTESRFRYYIYPHRISADADYILVYNDKSFRKEGYTTFARFDESSRILKRSGQSD